MPLPSLGEGWLPSPRYNIKINQLLDRGINRVLKVFEDFNYILEMKKRWEEIKRLQVQPAIASNLLPVNQFGS